MVTLRAARTLCAFVFVIALATPVIVRADDPPPIEDGPRKLVNHLECAGAVFAADLTHWTSIAAAIFACSRAFLDEPNWTPGGN